MALKKSVKSPKKTSKRTVKKASTKKVTKIKVASRRKANSKVANNKSKIAPYKPKKNEKYMELGKERTLKMMQKADEKNPDGPSLVSVWDKLPSNLKYYSIPPLPSSL